MATKKRVRKTKAPVRPAHEEEEGTESLGIFGGDEAEETVAEAQRESQEEIDAAVMRDFAGHGMTLGGIDIRPITFSDLAILQESESVFTNFTPLLTEKERERLLYLADKLEKNKKLTKKQEEEFALLSSTAMDELAMIKNTYMEVLKFFAIMSAERSTEEASDLVFTDVDGKNLRHAAIAIGKELKVTNFTEMSKEIALLIKDVQKTRVQPRPEKGKPSTSGNI